MIVSTREFYEKASGDGYAGIFCSRRDLQSDDDFCRRLWLGNAGVEFDDS